MSWLIKKITRNRQGRAAVRLLLLFCVLFSFLYPLPARGKVYTSGPKKDVTEKSRSLIPRPVGESMKVHKDSTGKKKKYKVQIGKDEVEVGDFATQKFKPQAKLKRWGEEAYLSVGVSQTNISTKDESVDLQGDRVGWESPKMGAGFYKTGQREIKVRGKRNKNHSFVLSQEGGFELEVILYERPQTNVISLPIESQGLKFYYQGPLTDQEKADGVVRPDEVIGSYAVYHESKKDGQYNTGKAFQIYRPKIVDAEGNWVWGELNINTETKILKITIDPSWLNSAVYPVIVDPEFGYTSIGSSAIPLENVMRGSVFTALEFMPASITAYLENIDSTVAHTAKYAIYKVSNTDLVGQTQEVTVPPASKGWYEGSYTTSFNLLAEEYALAANSNNGNLLIYFDDGAPQSQQSFSKAKSYNQDWPDTTTGFVYDDKIYSIYDAASTTIDITVTLDVTAPTAAITYSDADGIVKSGDSLTITATFSKNMADAPVPQIAISGANTVAATDMTRVSEIIYTYVHTVAAGNGTATIALSTGTDTIGNLVTSAPSSGATFTVDNLAPNNYLSCGDNIALTHTAGTVAPVTKVVTYGTVSTTLTGSAKCWITQNLGAANQATSATDATEDASGWYWQFNRVQGYYQPNANGALISTATPSTWDATTDNTYTGWDPAKDPCTLLLGTGWRLPTSTEWTNADATGAWANYNNTYASVLKLHAAGYLNYSTGTLTGRGSSGYYWSSTQTSSLAFNSSVSSVATASKAYVFSVRCLSDNLTISIFPISATVAPGATVTIASSGDTTNNVWFAPSGTTTFTANITTITKAANGVATSIIAPTTTGDYKLYILDAAGNISAPSTATLTVDGTAPTAAITYSDADSIVKSGDSLTITATFSKNMAVSPAPKISISGANTVAATNMVKTSATVYTYVHTVAAGNGEATVALSTGTDTIGNLVTSAPSSGATFTVDNIAPINQDTAFSSSATVKGGATVTIASSGDTTNNVWFAPVGTATFTAGATMTKATNGVATSILAPATTGDYKLYILDAAGNISAPSAATLTVDGTAPTAAITYSDADGIVKSGDSLTITATFNESMSDAPIPQIAISGSNTVAATNMTKTSATVYTYVHTVAAGNGTATIALSTGTDTVGNVVTSAPSSGATFTVDNIVPLNISCGDSFTLTHPADTVAPVTKEVTYGTVSTTLTGSAKCWITQNLGAANQATSATDATEDASGWYWQFNRVQGYYQPNANGALISTATPSTWAATTDNTYTGWDPAKDPCTLLLGTGWRLPTSTEWTNADATGAWANYNNTYASVLKLHAAGYLYFSNGTLSARGSVGSYWGSTQSSSANAYGLLFHSSVSSVANASKAYVYSVRCLSDNLTISIFPTSATVAPGATVTIASSGDATNNVWFAPSGTAVFAASTTMTKAASGTATTILSPADNGDYKLFVIDAAGNISAPSAATLTVDGTAPTAAITYSDADSIVKSGDSLTITATFSKNMADAPVPQIAISGANTVAATNMVKTSATVYTYVHTVAAGNGTATIALSTGTDTIGDLVTSAPSSGATFTVDNIAPLNQDTAFSSSATVRGGTAVTIASSGDATNNVWFAPSGTTTFIAGATMTKATNGVATSILAPATTGDYKLYILDAAGNISAPSAATLTVDGTAPTAAITYSDADGIVKSGDSLTITATFSEAMADAPIPQIAISGANTVAATNMVKTSATVYTYVHTVAAGNGTATIALSTGTDTIGNVVTSAPTSGATFTVDNLAPNNYLSCGDSFTLTHTAGTVAPVTKVVTYGPVSTTLTGSAKCWITQNLGAANQATSATDATEDASGWYWQFNRVQGYYQPNANGALISTATPSTWDATADNTYTGWDPAKDPCTLLLGTGWRLPTSTEWTNADATGAWANYNNTYASVLKLHAAGYLNYSNGALVSRGSNGYYWSSTLGVSPYGCSLNFLSSGSVVGNGNKAYGFSVRCLSDNLTISIFPTSATVAPGATVTIASSGDTTNNVWFAPSGTATFTAGATITKAVNGVATSILAPATAGDYKLYIIDAAGNVSAPSTAILTVDGTAPTAAITYSDADGIVKSGDSLTITATFNESMSDAPIPQIAISGSNTVAATNMTKTSATVYTYVHTVAAGNGEATVALSTGTDVVGNVIVSAPTSGATFTVDNIAPINQDTAFSSSATVAAGATVTIASSGDTTNNVWFAPVGTATFTAGATMTKATNGVATSILAPATTGDYKLYILDAAGNISAPSAATLTVDVTAPTAAITYSDADGIVKSGDSLTITATFNEAMADAPIPQIAISGANTVAVTNMVKTSATVYTYVHTVAAGNGEATVALSTGTDVAGNVIVSAPTSGATFTVDNLAPNNYLSCGDSFTLTHTAGTVAPVTKVVTYGTVSTTLTGSAKCWITQNLGAANQATSATDATEDASGWYWQFNRVQGYYQPNANGALISTATPSTWDATTDNTYTGWDPAKDPCTLLLGTGWRLPTSTEWTNADATGAWANYNNTYASVLKLHAAGYLLGSNGALGSRGSYGTYWSSTQASSTDGYRLSFSSSVSNMSNYNKAYGFSVRCLSDNLTISIFPTSATVAPGATVTIASSGDATNNVWFAPSGTTTFTANVTTITKAVNGVATSIIAPTTTGDYKLYIIDAAGNISAPSTATLTVDNTAPTAAITYSDADGIVKSGDSLTITATFNESMSDAPIPQIAISGSNTVAATNMTKTSATVYTYVHTVAAGNGEATVALSTGTDVVGNVIVSAPTSGATFTVDNLAPSAPVIGTFTATGGTVVADYLNNTNTGFTLTFTSPAAEYTGVAHLYVGDALLSTDITTTVSAESTLYTLTGNAQSIVDLGVDGAKALTVKIIDAAGNVSTATSAVNITKDIVAPTVTGVSSTLDGYRRVGAVIPVAVTFSKAVTVSGVPQLTLVTGSPATTVVDYASGSSSTALTFNYTVVTGNAAADLDYAATTSLAFNNGTIVDAAGNAAILTLAAPAAAGSLGANNALEIVGDNIAYWNNAAGTNNWSDAGNWKGGLPGVNDNVVFNTTSVADCNVDAGIAAPGITVANLTLDTGYTGIVTLSATAGRDLTVVNSITLTAGTLVDNGKTVNFKNVLIADVSGRLTSTGNWVMTASGNIYNPNANNALKQFQVGDSVTTTLTGATFIKKLVLGNNSAVIGNFNLAFWRPASNYITQGTGATISAILVTYLGSNISQGALVTTGDLYITNSAYTVSMTGNWNIGGNLYIEGDALVGSTNVLDTNGNNLNVGGYLTLGASSSSYPNMFYGKILFKTGTHTIGGKIYVAGGTTPSTCYTHGYIDLGSATINVGGNLDFRGASVYSTTTSATPTINLTGATAATLYGIVDYTYKDATYDTAAMIGKIPVYNLNCSVAGKVVNVNAGDTLLIGGTGASIAGSSPAAHNLAAGGGFSLAGASGNLLTFYSTVAGNVFGVDLTNGSATGMDYLKVKDSTASGKTIVTQHSSNDGNNTDWIFGYTPNAPTVTSIGGADNIINSAEKSAIIVIGTAPANALVSATLTDSNSHSKSGTQQLTDGATSYSITIDGTSSPAFDDGAITPSVTATDTFLVNGAPGSGINVSQAAILPVAILDTVPPTSSVVGTSVNAAGDTIAITFSEAMDTSTITNAILQANTNVKLGYADDTTGENLTDLTLANATVAWSDGNTKATVTLDEAIDAAYLPNGKNVKVTFAPQTVKDVAGNSMGVNYCYGGKVSKEGVPPVITNVNAQFAVAGDDTITIISNEVLNTAAQTLANWSIYYDDDNLLGGETQIVTTNAASSLDATRKILTLTLNKSVDGAYLPDGKYIKVLANANIGDLVGNTGISAAWSVEPIGGDTTAPTFTVAAASIDGGGDTITLTFNKVINTSTITNAILQANTNVTLVYADNFSGVNAEAITVAHATVAWDSTKKIATITLDELLDRAYIPDNKFVGVTLASGMVKDLAGNAVAPTRIYYPVSGFAGVPKETTPPVISATGPVASSSIKNNTVSYTLSEVCKSGNITWTRTGGTADPASPHFKTLTVAELNIGAHTDITLTNSPTLVNGAIYTIRYAALDLAGNAATIVQNTGVVYDTANPSISSVSVASNNSTPTLAKAGNTVTYSVNYNEPVTVAVNTASTANNIAAVVTKDVSASDSLTDSIIFTVASGDSGAITPNNINFTITDKAGNSAVITSLGTISGSVTADTAAPAITTISTNLVNDQAGLVAAGGLGITTVFSESMKTSTVPVIAYDPAGPTGSQACSAVACSSGGGWSTTTNTNDTYKACNNNDINSFTGDGTAVITVSAAEDLASNTVVSSTKNFSIVTTLVELKLTAAGSGADGVALSAVTAGTPFDITVTAKDTAGELKTNYTGIVKFETDETNTGKSLPANYTFTVADAGQKTFSSAGILITKGSKYIKVTDTVFSAITASKTVTVNSAVSAKYTLNAPSDITAGTVAAYTITRYDAYNNLSDVGSEIVYLTTNSTGSAAGFKDAAIAGKALTSITMIGGQSSANFWFYDTKTGSWTVTVSDAVPADGTVGVDDAIDAIAVLPAATDKFKVTSGTTTITAGDSEGVPVTITAYDLYSNLTTGYGGATPGEPKSLYFSGANASSSPVTQPTCLNNVGSAVELGEETICTFVNGVANTTLKLYKAEGVAIKAHNANPSTGVPTITTSGTDDLEILVNGGVASALSWYIKPEVKIVANAPWKSFAISVTDNYGNVSPSSATVLVTPSSGATISASSSNSAIAQSGVATFNNFAVYSTSGTYPLVTTLTASTGSITSSASDSVSVSEKYNITLIVKDGVTLGSLANVSLLVTDSTGNVITIPTHSSPWTGNSPFKDNFSLPYGTYTISLEKDLYVPTTVDLVADATQDGVDSSYDNDLTWNALMTSVAESMADYKVIGDFAYDEGSDVLTVSQRLERRGQQKKSDGVNNLGTATVNIYDGPTLIGTLTDTAADDQGNFWFSVANATKTIPTGFTKSLVSGKSYYAKCNVNYGGTAGDRTTYTSGTTFTITISQSLKTVTDAIQSVTTGIASQTAEIKGVVKDEIKSAIDNTLVPKITDVKTETAKILTASETTLPAKITQMREEVTASIQTEIKPHVQSGILTRATTIKQGDTIDISYRTATGLAPTITVYDSKERLRINAKTMTEIGTTGVYGYPVKFVASWGAGEFTVVCTELKNGTVDALVITVTQSNLEDVSGQVSAVLGSTSGITGLKNVAANLNTQFGAIDSTLAKLSANIAGKVQETVGALSSLQSVFTQLESISKQIKSIGGTAEGINLEKLYNVSKDKQGDVTYIKNKTQELKAAMDINQKLINNVANKPVVQTWFEFK